MVEMTKVCNHIFGRWQYFMMMPVGYFFRVCTICGTTETKPAGEVNANS